MTHPLTAYRETHRLNKRQIAEKLGVSALTVWRIETGRNRPSPALIERINDVTGGEVPPATWFNAQPVRADAC